MHICSEIMVNVVNFDVEMAEVEPEQTMPVKKEVVDESALDVSPGGTQLKRPTHFRNYQFLLEMYESKISSYTYLHPNITDYIRLRSDAKRYLEQAKQMEVMVSSACIFFRWFKFTLKPPYTVAHGNLSLAIWDTSHWTSFVKFGLKTA